MTIIIKFLLSNIHLRKQKNRTFIFIYEQSIIFFILLSASTKTRKKAQLLLCLQIILWRLYGSKYFYFNYFHQFPLLISHLQSQKLQPFILPDGLQNFIRIYFQISSILVLSKHNLTWKESLRRKNDWPYNPPVIDFVARVVQLWCSFTWNEQHVKSNQHKKAFHQNDFTK